MPNEYYNKTGWPSTEAEVTSAPARAEMSLIAAGFDKCPALSGSGSQMVTVNGTGAALTSVTDSAARASLGLVIGTDVQAYDVILGAIAGLTSAANKVPYFTSATTAGLLDFLDEDLMTSDSATAICSEQSIKAYADTQFATLDGVLTAPTDTRTPYYQALAPTGWTSVTGLDERMLFVHESNGGDTFGSVKYNAAITTGTKSNTHRHTYSFGGTTGVSNDTQLGKFSGAGGNNYVHYQHTHAITSGNSGNSTYNTADVHTHVVTAPKGIYVILGTKT